MRKRIEYLVLVALSAFFSYLLFLAPPGGEGGGPAAPRQRSAALTVEPDVSSSAAPAAMEHMHHADGAEEEIPPPEAGTPEGEEEAKDTTPTPPASPPEERELTAATMRGELERIVASRELIEQAREEVSGKKRRGFQSVLFCSAGDQLAIARFFKETIVLVPRSGLSPERPLYYRLDLGPPARIERVKERLPLERFRVRDLFAFPYEELPAPIRELRRRVFVRGDIYLFAALIPPSEWGLVIARRRAALAAHARVHKIAPRKEEEVRRFIMRYVRLPDGAFDVRVIEIEFADGSKWKVEDRA